MTKICDLSIAGERVEIWTDGDGKAWLKHPSDALLAAEREIQVFPQADSLNLNDRDDRTRIEVDAYINMTLTIPVTVIR